MTAMHEMAPLTNPHVLAIDRDADMVLLDGQLGAVHKAAIREDFGNARGVSLDQFTDFSFSPLGIKDPWTLHNFIIATMSDPNVMLEATPGSLESIMQINQVAQEAGTDVLDNVLTARTPLVAENTHRQLGHHYPGILFDTVTLMGNVTPEPPELPKWRHHAETAIDLKALGLTVAKVFIDDSTSAVESCVNEGGSNLGIIYGDYPWNRGPLPELKPGLDPQLHRIVHCKNYQQVTRVIVSTFFPDAAQRMYGQTK